MRITYLPVFSLSLVYGTYPLNPPKLHPPHYQHPKLLAPPILDSKRLSDSDLPVQKLASLSVSHKG